MNRVGFHSCYFIGTPLENNLFKIAELIYNFGGNAIECTPKEILIMEKRKRHKFRKYLEKLDLELIVGAGRSYETDPSIPLEVNQKKSLDFAKSMLKNLYEWGCHKWAGLIHAHWPNKPDRYISYEDKCTYLQTSANNIRQFIELADEYDVTLCFEAVNRFEDFLLNTSKEAISYCNLIGHPRAKILLDTFHMNIEEENIIKATSDTVKNNKLGHFHVGECNRNMVGLTSSRQDWKSIINALISNGYKGTIIQEPFLIPFTEFSHKVSLWRELRSEFSWDKYYSNVYIGINYIKELVNNCRN